MNQALALAEKGRSTVSPNPMVGCIIVKNGRIVGIGYHQKAGGPHAEVIALRRAGEKAKGATMYVTLEPCSHFGKTPPCSKAIIKAGIREVIIAQKDPNPKTRGLRELKDSKILVRIGVLEQEARKLNEVYSKFIVSKTPFVTLKLAVTLDGNIATSTGSSQYITSLASRTMVHRWRTQADGVMVGSNTLLQDNPRLTARHVKGKDPWKIVVDSEAKIPLSCNLMRHPNKLIIAITSRAKSKKVGILGKKGVTIILAEAKNKKVDLRKLIKELGKMSITSIMIEAGHGLATAAISQKIVDKVAIFVAPKIIGNGIGAIGDIGIRDISESRNLKDAAISRIGNDVLVEGYL